MSVQDYRSLAQDLKSSDDSLYKLLARNFWQNISSFHLSADGYREKEWNNLSSAISSSFENIPRF